MTSGCGEAVGVRIVTQLDGHDDVRPVREAVKRAREGREETGVREKEEEEEREEKEERTQESRNPFSTHTV
jgi:hypothetical protein